MFADFLAAAASASDPVADILPDDAVTLLVAGLGFLGVIATAGVSAWVSVRQGRKTRDQGTSEHLINASVVTTLRQEMAYGFGNLHEGLGRVETTATEAKLAAESARDISRTAAAAASAAAKDAAKAATAAAAAVKANA